MDDNTFNQYNCSVEFHVLLRALTDRIFLKIQAKRSSGIESHWACSVGIVGFYFGVLDLVNRLCSNGKPKLASSLRKWFVEVTKLIFYQSRVTVQCSLMIHLRNTDA